jgi:outer membrane protein
MTSYFKGDIMKIINLLVFPLICLLMLSGTSYADDNFKIGVVNFQQILQNSKSGQEIQSKIKQKGEAFKSELQKKQDEIKELQEKYKRESVILSNEQKVQKEREIRAELNEYRILQHQNTQEFNKIRTELVNDVQKIVVDFAQKFGKSEGYLLIIEKQSGTVLYAKDSFDITKQFVEEIDKQNSAEKK